MIVTNIITQTKSYRLTRGAGVLLPISALPSSYGIGTFGKASYEFVDFLKRSGFKYWQVLPIGPTGFGDSPYQSFSAFAGNPYFIDLNSLIDEKLISKKEVDTYVWQETDDKIDYTKLYHSRFRVLKSAYLNSGHKEEKAYQDFCINNKYWLEDYSLYMALKIHFGNREWLLWDEDIRFRNYEAIERYQQLLLIEIDFWKFVQYKFSEQYKALKAYAYSKGIYIIGDIPLYVAMDSADVWAHSDLFELDERLNPTKVAGVPPDLFSEDGQRWGNPLYRWDVMEENGFIWWKERMKMSSTLYDVIRMDHFIGVVNYYAIPVDCPTAVDGQWEEGPGRKLTNAMKEVIGDAKIIAEDLGVVTPKVEALIRETGFPGMKVLEFGFDGNANNPYLPHNYATSNIVAYTGTHDNDTLVGFLNQKNDEDLEYLYQYFNVEEKSKLTDIIIRALYACVADVSIVQMQDLLKLNNLARMNVPSTIGDNWNWRLKKEQYSLLDESKLYNMAYLYGRIEKEN